MYLPPDITASIERARILTLDIIPIIRSLSPRFLRTAYGVLQSGGHWWVSLADTNVCCLRRISESTDRSYKRRLGLSCLPPA